ncbi:PREDICTED: transcription factor TGA1-like [Populus euphratica]|uniref:Transcription factor TGA1-like n=1 Tax=Populus euphratica TaxID=75702 RepID=A0AAJ6UAI2_POPEU|nr:PREDICTED: transcription factor TGA1-like [Populus euphratica]
MTTKKLTLRVLSAKYEYLLRDYTCECLEVQRRLAQNREAARKSRLRKKAYVQQLESSRVMLIQLEQELDRARQQGLYMGGGVDASQLGFGGPTNPGIATFEMEYGHWLEEQNRHICDMRTALNAHINTSNKRLMFSS